jgi:hypothetical protein
MIQVLKDSWTRNPEDAQKTSTAWKQGEGALLDRRHDPALQGRVQITSEGIR